MKWTKDPDIIFLRESLFFEPWNYKYGSKERLNCWERINESLNQLTGMSSKVTQRSVQDTLRETSPNTEFSLVRIFLYSD